MIVIINDSQTRNTAIKFVFLFCMDFAAEHLVPMQFPTKGMMIK